MNIDNATGVGGDAKKLQVVEDCALLNAEINFRHFPIK